MSAPPIGRCTGPGEVPTEIRGTVRIPSGTLPLPDVTVYVPNGALRDMPEGAVCQPCGDELSGTPLVEALTDVNGEFRILSPPEGEDIQLVVEVGRWRRTTTIPRVEPCAVTEVDPEQTRLPRNMDEGHVPRIAITTGGWDALECLVRKIGINDDLFSTDSQDGRVHLFAGRDGTNRFDPSLRGGASFRNAWDWWNNRDNLMPYDIVMHSCEGAANSNDKPQAARQALVDFTSDGGRVFLSHWHQVWLNGGPGGFGDVANWSSPRGRTPEPATAFFDTSFPKGQQLEEWMDVVSTAPRGQFNIPREVRTSLRSIDDTLVQRWVWLRTEDIPGFIFVPPEAGQDVAQYFSFNTPVHAAADDQCGRVVFSDIHVSNVDNSGPNTPFPTGCSDTITDQERVLIFMFFDLGRCIIEDKF